MAKLIPFLCLALAVGLSDCSWSLAYGERTTNPGQVFADSDGTLGAANPAVPVEQYYDNAELQQSPLTNGNVEVYNPSVPLPEHKSGTKGGFFGFFKTKQQQPQIMVPFPGGQEQPFANSGYVETVPNLSVAPLLNSTPTTTKEPKNRLRGYLPWNWVFLPTSTQPAQESLKSAQPTVPKRSWSILPPYRPTYQPTRQQCQCWGQPAYTYPIYSVPLQTIPQYEAIPNAKVPNVQLVTPSEDTRGLESNPVPNYAVPPTSGTTGNFQPNLPTASKTSTLQAPPASTAEATDVTGQSNIQQGASQPAGFNFPSNNFSNNLNPPSIPVPTNNFQSSAGEVAQNSQQPTAN